MDKTLVAIRLKDDCGVRHCRASNCHTRGVHRGRGRLRCERGDVAGDPLLELGHDSLRLRAHRLGVRARLRVGALVHRLDVGRLTLDGAGLRHLDVGPVQDVLAHLREVDASAREAGRLERVDVLLDLGDARFEVVPQSFEIYQRAARDVIGPDARVTILFDATTEGPDGRPVPAAAYSTFLGWAHDPSVFSGGPWDFVRFEPLSSAIRHGKGGFNHAAFFAGSNHALTNAPAQDGI